MKKFLFGFGICLVFLLAMAWTPTDRSFNQNQFGTNGYTINIKSGALTTNLSIRGTATVVGALNASGDITGANISAGGNVNSDGTITASTDISAGGTISTVSTFEGDGSGLTNLDLVAGTNTILRSPNIIGASGDNTHFYLNTTNNGGTGDYWTNATAIFQRNESFDSISTRPWTVLLMNTNDLAGGTDAQNEVELAFKVGAPTTGDPHRAYLGWYHPSADYAGHGLQWVFGVNATKTVILNDSQSGVHRLWFEPGNSGAQPGMTYINSASNGAVRFNLGTTGSDSTALLGTGGVEFGSGGAGGLQTVVAKINSSGVLGVAGGIYATNLTASRPVFTDANKGLVSTTLDIIAGSNVTVTTNVPNRAWTIASTGGGGGSVTNLSYDNGTNLVSFTNNTDASFLYSDGTSAIWIDGGTTGSFLFRNLAQTTLMSLGSTVAFDNIPSGSEFRVTVDAGGGGSTDFLIDNGGISLRSPDDGIQVGVDDGGLSLSDAAITDGMFLYLSGAYIKGTLTPSFTSGSFGTVNATNLITLSTNAPFMGTDGDSKLVPKYDGSALTNLTLTIPTNAINTGVIPVGKTTYTNLTGNITIAGFSGVDLNGETWANIYVTNASGAGTPRSVTFAASVFPSTNTFVLDRAVWVTNAVYIGVKIAAWGTNMTVARLSP